MSSKLNEAISSTIGRMFMCEIEYRHYYDRLSRQVDDLLSGRRRPYKGVYYGNIRKTLKFHLKNTLISWERSFIGAILNFPEKLIFAQESQDFSVKLKFLHMIVFCDNFVGIRNSRGNPLSTIGSRAGPMRRAATLQPHNRERHRGVSA